MTGRRDLAALPAALRRLAAALDEVLSLAEVADTHPAASIPPTTRPGSSVPYSPTDTERVVVALWPPVAVSLMRDVERRARRRGDAAYRGRVRWIDPATRRYRGHTRTFDTPEAAWAWVRTFTAPATGHTPDTGPDTAPDVSGR